MLASSAGPSTETAVVADSAAGLPEPAELPAASIRHIMKRTLGGEQDAISPPSLAAVQRCTTEFLSLIVSEARNRVAKDRRGAVTYADILAALGALGFKQFQEPLKAHMAFHYGQADLRRPAKRAKTNQESAYSIYDDCKEPSTASAATTERGAQETTQS